MLREGRESPVGNGKRRLQCPSDRPLLNLAFCRSFFLNAMCRGGPDT